MTAIGTHEARRLVAEATQVGITAEQIADMVRLREDALDVMSGADRERVEAAVREEKDRQAALSRLLHLAGLSGRNVAQIRAKVTNWSAQQLAELAAQSEAYLRKQGVDTRTEADRQAAATGRATSRQVDYIVSLLNRRTRSGEGGGFFSTRGLVDEHGQPDRKAIAALTRVDASALIDSLTGNY